jgi:hypothetical protein
MTETAAAAFDRVLAYAGSRHFLRAPLETRLVAETRAVSGRIVAWADDPFNASSSEGTEWRSLVATPMTSRPAGFDTDQDGMPDTWESAQGLNPMLADNNGDQDADGYTNLEEYLNELAAFPAPTAILFLGSESERYAEARNFGLATPAGRVLSVAHWQPSRFDRVRLLAPRVVVDAPGQVAWALEVAGGEAPSVLAMTGGSLDVRERVSVCGVLELAGGTLRAGSLELAKSAVVRLHAGPRPVRVSGPVHLDGRLELDPGAALHAGESVTLLTTQGDVSGRFASVPPGHALDIVGGSVVLRSTEHVGPEVHCAAAPSFASFAGG